MSTALSLSSKLPRLALALLLAFVGAVVALTPASAQTSTYGAEAVTSCEAGSLRASAVRQGQTIVVRVRSDASVPQGEVEIRLGSDLQRKQLVNGRARYTVPASLAPGRYDLRMRYFPAANAAFRPCSTGVSGLEVRRAGGGGSGNDRDTDRTPDKDIPKDVGGNKLGEGGGDSVPRGDGPNAAGELGDTGGVPLWVLLAGLCAVIAGGALVLRGRRLT